jgi:hypothetical protein
MSVSGSGHSKETLCALRLRRAGKGYGRPPSSVEADALSGAEQARTATPLPMAATTWEVPCMLIALVSSMFSRFGTRPPHLAKSKSALSTSSQSVSFVT